MAKAKAESLEKLLFVGDVHVPFHDKRAWDLMLYAARRFRPDVIVAQEIEDFYAVSAHSKDPGRLASFDDEVAQVNEAFDELDDLGAGNRKVYVAGNHFDRLERYLRDKAPVLHSVTDPVAMYHLDRVGPKGQQPRGWEYVPYRRHTNVGKVHITHDVGAAGRNAIWKALDVFGHSVVTGHTHRLSYVVESNALGEPRVSASFGWLGDVDQIDYMNLAKAKKEWALGFGIGYHDPKTGLVYLEPVPIVDYTAKVEGKVYRA